VRFEAVVDWEATRKDVDSQAVGEVLQEDASEVQPHGVSSAQLMQQP